jgi:hypothetical protein
MHQNRVDPFGNVIFTSARGHWLGNRGVIHNDEKRIIKPFNHKAWIICQLQFKGRKRPLMASGRWTELFFLDEATALAAGHRPCFECRREHATEFKAAWIAGNPHHGFTMKTSISEFDRVIHLERIGGEMEKIKHFRSATTLPNGSFISLEGQPYLVHNAGCYRWSPFGYEDAIALPDVDQIEVLTPNSIVNAFQAGYDPHVALDRS